VSEKRSNGFVEAVALLTILPVTVVTGPGSDRPRTPQWFPIVGLSCVGFPAVAAALAGAIPFLAMGWRPEAGAGRLAYVAAACVIALWALLTRMLHWDGLADVADALWGGATVERRLEIMRDTVVGTFGTVAVVLVALIETMALAALMQLDGLVTLAVLLAVPVLGRLAATFAAWFGTAARGDGLGRSVVARPTPAGALVVLLTLGLAAAAWVVLAAGRVSGAASIAFWVVGIASAAMIPAALARRFGGVTGDVMGASVLLTETACLLILAVFGGL